MEHAPLRPVPARPAGPIESAAAVREVVEWLPTLPPTAARAFALVALAERPRPEVAELLEVTEGELSGLLAAARKELRQTTDSLSGSGWCERAERLISDRLDVQLGDTDARRLDVHLRNCPRCVEHERRLVQATDALILSLGGPIGAGGRSTPAPPLAEAPPQEEPPLEAPPEELPPEEETPQEHPPSGPTDEAVAAAAEVLVAVRTRRQIAAAVAWNALVVLAVLLAVAAIAFTVAGVLGAQL